MHSQPSQRAAWHPLCRRAISLRRHRSQRCGHNQRVRTSPATATDLSGDIRRHDVVGPAGWPNAV